MSEALGASSNGPVVAATTAAAVDVRVLQAASASASLKALTLSQLAFTFVKVVFLFVAAAVYLDGYVCPDDGPDGGDDYYSSMTVPYELMEGDACEPRPASCEDGYMWDGRFALCVGGSDCTHPNNFCQEGACNAETQTCEYTASDARCEWPLKCLPDMNEEVIFATRGQPEQVHGTDGAPPPPFTCQDLHEPHMGEYEYENGDNCSFGAALGTIAAVLSLCFVAHVAMARCLALPAMDGKRNSARLGFYATALYILAILDIVPGLAMVIFPSEEDDSDGALLVLTLLVGIVSSGFGVVVARAARRTQRAMGTGPLLPVCVAPMAPVVLIGTPVISTAAAAGAAVGLADSPSWDLEKSLEQAVVNGRSS